MTVENFISKPNTSRLIPGSISARSKVVGTSAPAPTSAVAVRRKLVPHLKGELKPVLSAFERLLMDADSVPAKEKEFLLRRQADILNLKSVQERIDAEAARHQQQLGREEADEEHRLMLKDKTTTRPTGSGRSVFSKSFFGSLRKS